MNRNQIWTVSLILLSLALYSRLDIRNVSAAEKDLETSVSMMAKIGACFSPSFSPDGQQIAFVSNLNGVPQIWIVSSNGGWPKLVTAIDDPIGSVIWSPQGDQLAFSLAPGGGMNQQVYLINLDGSGLRLLTNGGKETNWLGDWTHDGRFLTLASNRDNKAAMDAYIVDLSDSKMSLISRNQGIGYFIDVSRDGRYAILFRLVSRGSNDLFLVNLATGDEVLLTPHDGPGSFFGKFSPDGQTIYLSSNKDRDLIAFGRIKLTSMEKPGAIEILSERQDGELQGFVLNKQGTRAVLNWNVAGCNELSVFDLAKGKTENHSISLPNEIVSGLTFSKDGQKLAMALSGAAAPRDIWVYNFNNAQLQQVTHSPYAGVNLEQLIRPELVRFPAHDGLELSGWLYRPSESTSAGPIVLSFHGGPEGQDRPYFRSIYQALLSQGIAVFAPNVRGSSGFGKTFVNLDNGALRFNGIKDIESCVDYVVQKGIADPGKIGIMGGSYGGYMVMAGLTEYPNMFAAGVNLFGVVNFETFFANTEPWMAAISTVEYGDPKTESDLLRRLSPIHNVDQVIVPTLVLHGANDTNVPVIEAEQVVDSLKERNIPVEYILFPDEGHGFRKTPNRIRSDVSTVRWFTQYLR
ncbi:prolyl oligopeptidase family serine peptidase [Candidatus Latescibacterota bacterium]